MESVFLEKRMSTRWGNDYVERAPKLEYYGTPFYARFMHRTKSTLYQDQKGALKALVEWFTTEDTENMTAVVVMPTGTGKTGVICCLPYALMSQLPPKKIDTSKPILMVTPGRVTLDELEKNLCGSQDSKSFLEQRNLLEEKDVKNKAKYAVHVIKVSSDVGKLEQKKHEFDIALSNAQKWRDAEYCKNLPSDLFSIVIVDEAHYLPAKTWKQIVEKFQAKAKIVFFSASPYRGDHNEITIDRAISTKGYAYHLTQDDAAAKQLTRRVEWVEIKEPPHFICKPDQMIEYYKEISQEAAKKKVIREVKKLMDEKQPLLGGQKHTALLITENVNEAYKVEKICKEVGFDDRIVKVLNSAEIERNAKKRSQAIQEIQNGKIQVIIIVKMLLEGFKYPPISIAGIVTKIRSPLKFAKLVGQIQRKDGGVETEGGVTGDIVTHEYFEQGQLWTNFKTDSPHILTGKSIKRTIPLSCSNDKESEARKNPESTASSFYEDISSSDEFEPEKCPEPKLHSKDKPEEKKWLSDELQLQNNKREREDGEVFSDDDDDDDMES